MFKNLKTPKDKPISGELRMEDRTIVQYSIWTNKNGGIREINASWNNTETVYVYNRKAKRKLPEVKEVQHNERLGWDKLQGRDPRITDYESYMIMDYSNRYVK